MESTADQWSDAQLTEYIGMAVGDLSRIIPNITSTTTYTQGNSGLVSVSSLSYYRILAVDLYGATGEHPVPIDFKNWRLLPYNYIEIDPPPSGDQDVTGTADGDVTTHLQDDTNAQFTALMAYAHVVNTTDSLESYATTYNDAGDLTLAEDIFPDGDEDYIVYERVPVRIWYEGKHTYTETTRTFSANYEDIVCEGAICYALMGYAIESATTNNIGGATVSEKMLMMANNRLSLYRKELQKIRPLRHTERYG